MKLPRAELDRSQRGIKVCKRCIIPETRPGITYDDEGICFPCRVAEHHSEVDWLARKKELQEISRWGREHSKCEYDCIVAVSGGKDSTRQALYARYELGLNPLLVSCTYPPQQQIDLGAYNVGNMISLGFDTIVVGPKPETWKKLMRNAFYRFGNWAKATEMALYAIPPRVATAYKIPLIFLGENNALNSGDLGGSLGGDANKIKDNNTLAGGKPTNLMDESILEKDVLWHQFPSDKDMADANVRIVYMGYYIEDFDPFANAKIALRHGLKVRNVPREDIGAYNLFEDLDEDFVHVNQLLKYFKLGFARVTDDACQAIRRGLMTREEGIELVKKYEGRCHQRYIENFCKYLEITEDEFWKVANSFRNKEIWEQLPDGEWKLHRQF